MLSRFVMTFSCWTEGQERLLRLLVLLSTVPSSPSGTGFSSVGRLWDVPEVEHIPGWYEGRGFKLGSLCR